VFDPPFCKYQARVIPSYESIKPQLPKRNIRNRLLLVNPLDQECNFLLFLPWDYGTCASVGCGQEPHWPMGARAGCGPTLPGAGAQPISADPVLSTCEDT